MGVIPNAKKYLFSPIWLNTPNLKLLKNSKLEIQYKHENHSTFKPDTVH